MRDRLRDRRAVYPDIPPPWPPISLLLEWSLWPLRVAMIGVTLTNLEAIAITATMPHWRADVISWFKAKRLGAERSGEKQPGGGVK